MICTSCNSHHIESGEQFCRRCGTSVTLSRKPTTSSLRVRSSMQLQSQDPDELVGNGIGSVIMGDGFFITAVLLSATNSAVGSLLWLLLLIPAFFFFGKGFTDVFRARQIRRRQKNDTLAELPPPRASIAELINDSGRLLPKSRRAKTTHELS
jgi:hypothetical protein